MRDEDSIARAIGEERHVLLDGAFNSEGVGCAHSRVHGAKAEDFDRILSINLRGVFLSIKYRAGAMLS
ncbi:hypothetical protein [Sphingomonas bacterium]|uniref:hypothetical protein n=1 Tax=Sphingomonas bacterium TaxID=1895847 RepID=UPI001576B073|nr:hypothetical protein [Sphingomonas bacterium]